MKIHLSHRSISLDVDLCFGPVKIGRRSTYVFRKYGNETPALRPDRTFEEAKGGIPEATGGEGELGLLDNSLDPADRHFGDIHSRSRSVRKRSCRTDMFAGLSLASSAAPLVFGILASVRLTSRLTGLFLRPRHDHDQAIGTYVGLLHEGLPA